MEFDNQIDNDREARIDQYAHHAFFLAFFATLEQRESVAMSVAGDYSCLPEELNESRETEAKQEIEHLPSHETRSGHYLISGLRQSHVHEGVRKTVSHRQDCQAH